MDWGDLRFFVALARQGTLAGAARDVRTEHTTVARRISSLEQSLGTRLFEREAKGFVLTVEGERIVEHAKRIEAEVFSIHRQLDGSGTELEGVVRISAPPVFAASFLSARLAELGNANSKLVIELAGENQSVSLSRREADIAIRLARPESQATIARKVGHMAYDLYGEKDYVEKVPQEDWAFLAYDKSLETIPQQKWLLNAAAGRRVAFRSNDLAALHSVAANGSGIAGLPRYLGDADPRLQRIGCPSSEATRELWLLVHPDLRQSPRIRIVFDHLVETLSASRSTLDPDD